MATAANPLVLIEQQDSYELGYHLEYLEDRRRQWSVQDISSEPLASRFRLGTEASPNKGFTDSAYWVRLTLENRNQNVSDWRLVHNATNFNYIDFYEPTGDSYRIVKTGNRRHFDTRDVDHNKLVFRVALDDSTPKTFYLRLQNQAPMLMDLKLVSANTFGEQEVKSQLWQGVFYGALLIMLFYNAAMGVVLRDKEHFFNLSFIFLFLVSFSHYDGYLQQHFLPMLVWVSLIPITLSVAAALAFLFTNSFLQLELHAPRLFYANKVGFFCWCGFVILSLALPYQMVVLLSSPFLILTLFVMLGEGCHSWYNGYRPAGIYTLSWIGLAAGLALLVLSHFPGPLSIEPEYGLRGGVLFLVTLLSLALAEQLKQMREEKRDIQQELADTLLQDNQEMRQLHSDLEKLAYDDLVTGLPNRSSFLRHAEEVSHEKEDGSQLWIAIAAVDNFKPINDRLGQRAGDALLKHVADRLKNCAPADCNIYRWIGDSFIYTLYGDRDDVISSKLKAIKAATSDPFVHDRNQIKLSLSIGVSQYEEGGSMEALLVDVGLALQSAKQLGRDRIVFFDHTMKESEDKYLEIHWAMADAVKNKEFSLYYQPLFGTKNRRIEGFEALLRWHNADGMVRYTPDEFITVAERNGLMIELGNFVIQSAIEQAYNWNKEGRYPYHMSLNISPMQFGDEGFFDALRSTLERFPVDPGLIKLEITESLFAGDSGAVLEKLLILKKLGLQLSLDDFGTGYSSLAYIQQYPFDTIKIDKCFVDDVHKSKHSQALVSAVLSLAQNLSMSVVAEGVETKAQVDYLTQLDIELLQGYYFSKPLSPEQVSAQILNPPGNLTIAT